MLPANNRWGIGITAAAIEAAIARNYGGVINYDIFVCAAFSTGYLPRTTGIFRRLSVSPGPAGARHHLRLPLLNVEARVG
jgi:hypothetical protein